jgi:Flp pilus assembly protein TadD
MKYGFAAVAASLLLVVAGCGDRADAENASTPPTQESVAETGTSSSAARIGRSAGDVRYHLHCCIGRRCEESRIHTVSLSLTDVSSEDEAGLQARLGFESGR